MAAHLSKTASHFAERAGLAALCLAAMSQPHATLATPADARGACPRTPTRAGLVNGIAVSKELELVAVLDDNDRRHVHR